MEVDLYTSFQKYSWFWLEKRGSTYTRIDLDTRKYGNYMYKYSRQLQLQMDSV